MLKKNLPGYGTAPRGTVSAWLGGGLGCMFAGDRAGEAVEEVEMYGSGCLYGQSGPLRQFGQERHGVC